MIEELSKVVSGRQLGNVAVYGAWYNFLAHMLFENFDIVVEAEMEERIINTLKNYEPRVKVLNVEVSDLSYRNALSVKIEVEILSPENVITDIEFIIERLR